MEAGQRRFLGFSRAAHELIIGPILNVSNRTQVSPRGSEK